MTTLETSSRRTGPLRSFGRQKGRRLSARQSGLIETLLPRISAPAAPAAPFQPLDLLPSARAVWFEVGFGGGEHLVGQAKANPDILIIGVEPFEEGVAKALTAIDAAGLSNVRLLMGDSRPLLDALADASLDRAFILFPDPWPKPRHWKRRIIQPAFVANLARAMKPGSELRFATDVRSYADWAHEHILHNGHFEWLAEGPDDWRLPPPDHITTRYEEKRLGDCAPVFLRYRRFDGLASKRQS